jgi:hypothetical protein
MGDLLSEVGVGQEVNVSGPGIESLKQGLMHLYTLQAPTMYDDVGFNKPDWNTVTQMRHAGVFDKTELPLGVVNQMLNVLSHYKNTQYADYESVKKAVQQDIVNAGQTVGDKAIVYNKHPKHYGKIAVYLPKQFSAQKLNKITDAFLAEKGVAKDYDNYGKHGYGYVRWKYLQKAKDAYQTYWVHGELMPSFIKFLEENGIEVEYEQPMSQDQPVPDEPEPGNLVVMGLEDFGKWGKKIAIQIQPFEKSKQVWDRAKEAGLTPQSLSYKSGPSRHLINARKADYEKVLPLIAAVVDTTALEEFVKKHDLFPEGEAEVPGDAPFSVQDAGGAKILLTIEWDKLGKNKDFFKDIVKFTFPLGWKPRKYDYVIEGNFKQYSLFGQLLKKFGFPVEELRSVLRQKVKSGDLKQTTYEGQLDPEFVNTIEKRLPESTFELYNAQKSGVGFLYSRDHSVLGDETGLGKTVQLISAAAIKMQESNQPTLIITLKATQDQWVNEILNVEGQEVKDSISTDPLHPQKWTVLYYENFSSPKGVEKYKTSGHPAGLSMAYVSSENLDDIEGLAEKLATQTEQKPEIWIKDKVLAKVASGDIKAEDAQKLLKATQKGYTIECPRVAYRHIVLGR